MQIHKKVAVILSIVGLLMGLAGSALAYEATTGPTGVLKYEKGKAFEGYTLISPTIGCKDVYLFNMEGDVVHKWHCQTPPGLYAELLPNGNLLRAGQADQKKQLAAIGKYKQKGDQVQYVAIGGTGGTIQEIDWDGKVVWEYVLAEPYKVMQHHTFHRMPNGNTLILGWEYMTKEEALKAGRDPKNFLPGPVVSKKIKYEGFWNDFVIEVNKKGETVWEWHVKDHLGKGPDKLDFNYVLPRPVGDLYNTYDWSHFNTVSYIPETDTVVLNSRNLAEFYFINHKTGKIEYRWGNPTTYDPKAKKPSWYDNGDQKVWGSHCATPLANGNVLVFDNGSERPEGNRSAAVEVDPKTGKVVWEYRSRHSNSFYSYRQGGVQRLPNGNTLICSTHGGHLIEVTPDKKVVWEFVSPIVLGKLKCVLNEGDAFPAKVGINAMMNMIHRAYRYGPDYPGLKGKDLSVKEPLAPGCPQFFKVYKKGLVATSAKKADKPKEAQEEAEDDEDGPAMHAY